MSGIRVYELAKEIGVQSKTLVDLLSKMGYPVKSHSSTIENSLADRLRRQTHAMGIAGTVKTKAKAKPAESKQEEIPAPKAASGKKAAAKTAEKPAPAHEEHVEAVKEEPAQLEIKPDVVEEKPPVETKAEAPAPVVEVTPPPAPPAPAPVPVEIKPAPAAPAPAPAPKPPVERAPLAPRPAPYRPTYTVPPGQKPVGGQPARPPYTGPSGQRPGGGQPPRPGAPGGFRQDRRPGGGEQFRGPRPGFTRPGEPPRPGGKGPSAPPILPKKPDSADKFGKKKEDHKRDRRWEDDDSKKLDKLKRHEGGEARRREDEETRRANRELEEKRRKEREEEAEIQRLIAEEEREKQEAEARKIVIDEATTVKEFAEKLRVGVNEIIRKLIGKGIMATLNQTIEADVAKEIALEMGYEIVTREETEIGAKEVEVEDASLLQHRPPVVTIMGHVDHGKTSLLDTIRKTNVTEGEAGGITQRIGAYTVKLGKGTVVFLDTPGHEAFTALRARGAAVTDLVVLVVAADDGVMPQTVEAIHHAKAAGVPVLVAVNKIDKPGANIQRIREELAGHELVSEEWGGSTIFCEVSAKKSIGIDHLLEMLLLQADVLELKADPDRPAFGAIIESKLDKGRGPVATVLVQKGTLKIGDPFVAGVHHGKVRALIDDKGHRIDSAGPSTPVEVLGISGVPTAGETFMVMESERRAHQVAINRMNAERQEGAKAKGHLKLENLHAQVTKGGVKELNIIIKADFQGSIEAVKKALEDIKVGDVRIRVLHGAVGGITETDVALAAASDAIVIGFNVRPSEKAKAQAEAEDVDVRLYSIIYNAIDDIKAALEGMLEPVFVEKVTGKAEVRQVFNVSKVGIIAGCLVASGKVNRGNEARLIRDNVVIYSGKVTSLRRLKDDVKEVVAGYECGIGIGYSDLKVGDAIETFVVEKSEKRGE
ncbi:MAG: translation initiation factor IF-2 [Nitrospinae bacterium]|nr:translation initiation factor IF-2 [Nitrospinota bacterium]